MDQARQGLKGSTPKGTSPEPPTTDKTHKGGNGPRNKEGGFFQGLFSIDARARAMERQATRTVTEPTPKGSVGQEPKLGCSYVPGSSHVMRRVTLTVQRQVLGDSPVTT